MTPTGRRGGRKRVGILGSGLMGGKLGTIFARAGHDVTFSYARGAAKLEHLARGAGNIARAGTPGEAEERSAGDLSGKILVSCSLPMNADDTALVAGHTTSGAEELAKMVPRARVVSAFNTVPSEVLFAVYEARSKARRPGLVYCGDDEGAKETTAELIRDAGFEPVDAGPLRIARYTEPFALLVGQLAYEGSGGPELAYRFERFGTSPRSSER